MFIRRLVESRLSKENIQVVEFERIVYWAYREDIGDVCQFDL